MRNFYVLIALLASSSIGCWEQWSVDWFPQMKWQKAVQAYERPMHEGRVDQFMPPSGTVPVGAPGSAKLDKNDEAGQSQVQNPQPASLASLENGRVQYETFCATCHGVSGAGDGPVSMMGPIQGPFVGVLPLVGAATLVNSRSDGHLHATIRYGRRRMPSYQRIPEMDRWDIVNYLRYLNGQKGVAAK
jgi:mono/diheme cytochrome c family protein